MDRRKLLKTGSVIVAGGIAGCMGGEEPAEDNNGGTQNGDGGAQDGTSPPEDTQEDDVSLPSQARFIIPSDPGGGFDSWGRIGVKAMEGVLNEEGHNVNFVSENIPANDGVVGINKVYESEGDGSVIGVTGYPTKMVPQKKNPAAEYDLTEISLIGRVCSVPGGITLTTPDSNINSWSTFVEEAQNRKVVIGTKGPEGRDTVIFELIKEDHNLENLKIASALEGKSDQISALQRGDIEVAPMEPTSARELYNGDKAQYAFAIAEPGWDRAPVDVETRAENINDDQTEYYPIFATNCILFGPKRSEMDEDILQVYRDALAAAAESDTVQQWEEDTGRVFAYRGGETIRENNELKKAMDLTEQYLV